MFDLVSWGIGYTLKQGAEWLKVSVLFRKDLVEALSTTAEKWNDGLPNKFHMDEPEILFKPVENENLEDRPQLKILRMQLMDGHIPEPEIWSNAALEHIHFVRHKLSEPGADFWAKAALGPFNAARRKLANDVNPFFEADDEEIMPHLNELGRRLTLTIMQDVKTTLPLMYRQLQRIESKLDQLSAVTIESDRSDQ